VLMFKPGIGILAICVLALLSLQANARVTKEEAEKLGGELTPYGAETAGNAAGTIPAWEGGIAGDRIPATYKPSERHPDPYSADKMLYRITAANMAQYADQLPE